MRIRVRVAGYVKGDGTSQATVAHFDLSNFTRERRNLTSMALTAQLF